MDEGGLHRRCDEAGKMGHAQLLLRFRSVEVMERNLVEVSIAVGQSGEDGPKERPRVQDVTATRFFFKFYPSLTKIIGVLPVP